MIFNRPEGKFHEFYGRMAKFRGISSETVVLCTVHRYLEPVIYLLDPFIWTWDLANGGLPFVHPTSTSFAPCVTTE